MLSYLIRELPRKFKFCRNGEGAMPTMAPFHSTTTASNMPNHHDHQAAEVRVARRAPLNLGDEARGRREGRLGRGHSCTALNIPFRYILLHVFMELPCLVGRYCRYLLPKLTLTKKNNTIWQMRGCATLYRAIHPLCRKVFKMRIYEIPSAGGPTL